LEPDKDNAKEKINRNFDKK
jgi:hypothetical protein